MYKRVGGIRVRVRRILNILYFSYGVKCDKFFVKRYM